MGYKGETKQYELTETGKVYRFPANHCVFCKHCMDFVYDSGGPYMFFCEFDDDEMSVTEQAYTCERFEDDGYVFNEAEYFERMEAQRRFREQLENNPEVKERFEKVVSDAMKKMLGIDMEN